jgi:hypothetical protein
VTGIIFDTEATGLTDARMDGPAEGIDMSDKPLDAIGFDSARGVGKHDFVRSPRQILPERFSPGSITNIISGQPPVFSLDALTHANAVLKTQIDPMEIDHADCGADYWDALAKHVPTRLRPAAINVFLGMFDGFRIRVDTDIPSDVIEFKNKDGAVVYADCL